MACRFPDGYSADETLVLLQLAWSLGSPAIAAHCGARIFQMADGSIVSPADFDVQSWQLVAQDLTFLAVLYRKLRAALRKDLVPLACLTDHDVKVMLEAEEKLCKRVNNRQHASAVFYRTSDASTDLGTASSEDQNSQLQSNVRECISAAPHQALGASTVRATLELNNRHQLQDKHSHGMTHLQALNCNPLPGCRS